MYNLARIAAGFVLTLLAAPVLAQELCEGYGPQTPRDIGSPAGDNTQAISFAPAANLMNLCNLHSHVNAEHKGPGFSISGGTGEHGGWKCNETASLSAAELAAPDGAAAFEGAKPGDSLEVHWVYSTCNVGPGNGLGSCLSEACSNPQLRVEAQVFLLVNDPDALDFADFAYAGNVVDGLHQPRSLPGGTGDPVRFIGSTTGPSFSESACSPLQVTWNVRPTCAKLDINSLHKWAADGNMFEEDHAHGVRQLVTAPALLAPID